jgi:anthranilate 1,2-dioxygenase small subunit
LHIKRSLPAAVLLCASVGMMRDRVVSLRHANIYGRQYYRHLVTNIKVSEVWTDHASIQSNY